VRKTGPKNEQGFKELRSRAEKSLRRRYADTRAFSDKDVQKLIQELSVHQVELEMQNEELRNAQQELVESRDRYFDLYDLAPVGYFTLDDKGLILEVNLAGADLLGSDRASLIKKRFSRFVAPDSQDPFYSHRRQALDSGSKQVFDLELKRKNGEIFYAQLQSVAVEGNEGNGIKLRTAVVDITERKQAEMAFFEAHIHLERKIEERTADLLAINARLREEIEERKRVEEALQGSERELHLLASRLLTIQEDERKRVALDLHDSIAQSIVAIRMFMEVKIKSFAGGSSPEISLDRIYAMLVECITELRRIIDHLRPTILEDLGAVVAVNRHCVEFQNLNHEIRMEQEIALQEADIPKEMKIAIYRILQEALNNVSKHSHARSVKVFLRKKKGGIELRIEDDGVGFEVNEIRKSGLGEGIGISSMKERARLAGGSISIQSRMGGGTAVIASWNC
jgi:PAS domain S-box-containing protein